MTNQRNAEKGSDWQAKIAGEWHGMPSMFDAEGNQVGHIKVSRASSLHNGRVTYTMDTALDVRGPLRARFEARDFVPGYDHNSDERNQRDKAFGQHRSVAHRVHVRFTIYLL